MREISYLLPSSTSHRKWCHEKRWGLPQDPTCISLSHHGGGTTIGTVWGTKTPTKLRGLSFWSHPSVSEEGVMLNLLLMGGAAVSHAQDGGVAGRLWGGSLCFGQTPLWWARIGGEAPIMRVSSAQHSKHRRAQVQISTKIWTRERGRRRVLGSLEKVHSVAPALGD